MKRLLLLFAMLLTFSTAGMMQAAQPIYQNPSNSGATINVKQVWATHNEYKNERKGMMIHVKFNIQNSRGVKGRIVVYFHYQGGKALKDFNGQYRTTGGDVSVGEDFTPRYDNSDYNDFTIFMPYEELHMGAGSSKLDYNIGVFQNGRQLYNGIRHNFTYTK